MPTILSHCLVASLMVHHTCGKGLWACGLNLVNRSHLPQCYAHVLAVHHHPAQETVTNLFGIQLNVHTMWFASFQFGIKVAGSPLYTLLRSVVHRIEESEFHPQVAKFVDNLLGVVFCPCACILPRFCMRVPCLLAVFS